ncbi:MAG: DUF4465 domain-containing protein [Bacteroidales bacterium]|nr:DUF4465 domain-containing protein [Bacteroidales bacterium]
MKKISTLLMAAMAAVSMQATDYVLNLNAPSYPEVINYTANGNAQVWSDTYNEEEYILEFTPFMFGHILSGSSWGGSYWDGFTVVKCSDNAKQANWITNQWGIMAGGGLNAAGQVDANEPYLFAYCPDFMGPGLCTMYYDDENTYYVKGMYVNISAYSYYACKEGAAPARAFNQEGDSYLLTASGKDANGNTKSCSIELAGYHNGQFTALTDWTWFDMSSLGNVEDLTFVVTTTDMGDWGANTPLYFAIDKLTVSDQAPVPTAVDDVTAAKTIASVKYANLAGQMSDTAFDGVNVKVTTYTDGTTATQKLVK